MIDLSAYQVELRASRVVVVEEYSEVLDGFGPWIIKAEERYVGTVIPVITMYNDVFVLRRVWVFHTPVYLNRPKFVDSDVQTKDNAEGGNYICFLLKPVFPCANRDEIISKA